MFGLNYEGLKKKETYDEIVDYLMNKQEKIKMPNRLAKQLRNSPQLSNVLDGDGAGLQDVEDQQKRAAEEVEKEHRVRDAANVEGGGPTERRTFQQEPRQNIPKTSKGNPKVFNMSIDDFQLDVTGAIGNETIPSLSTGFLREYLASQVPQV